jgi:hypothetical protein
MGQSIIQHCDDLYTNPIKKTLLTRLKFTILLAVIVKILCNPLAQATCLKKGLPKMHCCKAPRKQLVVRKLALAADGVNRPL